MDNYNNRTCVVCGKEYHACHDCEEARLINHSRWRNSCDVPECFQVLLVLTDYYNKVIDKSTARELLDKILTVDMLPYEAQAKILIDEIYDVVESQEE